MLTLTKRSALGAVAAAALVFSAAADEAAVAGRTVLDAHKNAVVTVSLVIKQQFSMGGSGSQEQEEKAEVTGTVIDPSGLTVLSLSQTDPSALIQSMMGDMTDGGDMKIDSTLADVKIITEDGKELAAKVVLRDKDLDLAFIRPTEKPAAPLASINLKESGTPQILDQILVLNRLGKVANRAYAMSVDRVEAIIAKPRTFYVPGRGESTGALGCPAFTIDGKIVGVALLRTIPGGLSGGGMMSMMGGGHDSVLPVILPAADILEAGQQAPAAADVKDEPKPKPEPAPAAAPSSNSVTIPATPAPPTPKTP
ncbi:MAG: trypsin-like peptidase domain-containing protein [Candidatus Hydrogenedentes bacterium]|nr:trypsin-like peptidase domain-containing protein [Candidatus Hydrogenedentota bacterium]